MSAQPRRLSAKIMRLISPSDENLRMELRHAVACSEAHAEDLTRTIAAIPAHEIAEMIRKVKESAEK